MKTQIGFLGTGIMGNGMCHTFLRAGHTLTVWNRSEKKYISLVEAGATAADSPAAVATTCDVLFLCVTNESVVEQLIFDPEDGVLAAANAPRVIVDTSTISPNAAISFATRLAERDIAYIDAPVSGGDIGARNGTLTIMAGGETGAFQSIVALLNCIGKNVVYTGPSGNGQKTKCINQVVVALNVAAMTEGLFLAEKSGLDLETTLGAIAGGAAGSWSLDNYAPRVLAGNLGPGFYARDMLKDLRYVSELARVGACELPVCQKVIALYEELVDSDPASTLGNHALIKRYREPRPGTPRIDTGETN